MLYFVTTYVITLFSFVLPWDVAPYACLIINVICCYGFVSQFSNIKIHKDKDKQITKNLS